MALGTVKDDFSWFCGVLKLPTNVSLDDPDDGRNSVEGHEDDNGPWLCVVSAVGTALHSVFLLLFVVLLVIFTCRLNAQSSRTSNPQRCPGNVLRWLILAFLLFILSCAIGEGVLTDSTRPQVFPTQPYLYLPSLCALLATFTAAVYYNSMERWRKFHMSLLSIFYWITCFAIQAATLWCLIQLGHGSVEVLRFDLSLCLLAAYVVFIILDLLVLKTLVPCRNLSYRPTPTSDSIPGDLYYVHDDVSVLSQVTLGWLTKFLRLGNKRSLERKDLGSLPERHTSQENFKRFKEVFLKEKANALKNNQKVSLFRVFGHFCGIRLLAVGLLKVVSVFVKFVTPAAIRVLIFSGLATTSDHLAT
ncbi:ATP-binding cassette sub-family C member 8-like [Acanthaster planci]|uniref:ATP-binding cassette sub-family C member 8-like n=1 Tax=Acanthaster planci TaxID=133434 RepID=A0A8B7XYC6_ACAPL|nr:ATP-binding cassette sub-family C member 8-like [Acanthaster planci]